MASNATARHTQGLGTLYIIISHSTHNIFHIFLASHFCLYCWLPLADFSPGIQYHTCRIRKSLLFS